MQKSAGKVLILIFWDQDSILLIDYLPKGQTINAEYYSSLLGQLTDILKEIRHGKFTNAQSHWALATCKKLFYLGFQCLDHPPYSPYLAPSDYHLFPGLKKQLKSQHFSSTETWLDGQPSEFFLSGLQKLEQWPKRCIEFCGEYAE
jgi:histone-lysine N-methyltransferase SETMAR